MKKKPYRSRIAKEVHTSAKGLHRIGLLSKKEMDRFDVLCKPIPAYTAKQIKAIRKKYNLSQIALAKVINASISTVCKWEIGLKHPCGTSLKVLDILNKKGLGGLNSNVAN